METWQATDRYSQLATRSVGSDWNPSLRCSGSGCCRADRERGDTRRRPSDGSPCAGARGESAATDCPRRSLLWRAACDPRVREQEVLGCEPQKSCCVPRHDFRGHRPDGGRGIRPGSFAFFALSVMGEAPSIHVPVLAEEVLQWLQPLPGQTFVDGTLGGGGHTRLLAEKVGPDGCVVALDRDPQAIPGPRATCRAPRRLVQADFRDLGQVLRDIGIAECMVFCSTSGSPATSWRTFTADSVFRSDGDLDLRFDPTSGQAAWQLLDRLGADQMADVIYEFGEERFSRRIARRIVRQRELANPQRLAAQQTWFVRVFPVRGATRSIRRRRTFRPCGLPSTTSWEH